MKLHGNARTCPRSRRLLVERVRVQGWSVAAAAAAAGVSERTGWKWLARWRSEGEAGLVDRSSRPRCLPRATLSPPGFDGDFALPRIRWSRIS
jgi:hypothetical protein